jgi:hypothetical protein
MNQREPGTKISVGWTWSTRPTRRQVKAVLPALLTFVFVFFVVAGPLSEFLVGKSIYCVNRDMC